MAKGEQVARLPVSALQSALGDFIEVRKSQVPGKKYPLYMVTPWGPWPINTAAGQDFILENALFNGAPAPEKSPEAEPESQPENPETPGEVQGELIGLEPDPTGEVRGGPGYKSFIAMMGDFD